MKSFMFILFILLFSALTLTAKDEEEKNLKTFDFESADITGNKTKPAGSSLDVLKNTDMKTKIKPREDFLPELSGSIDELWLFV